MDRRLNVAVATDTILYVPFYMALYGDDFKSTPWGELKINVVGSGKDPNFKPIVGGRKTGIDGFVTLCVFFDYADVGIGDPSFLLHLLHSTNFRDSIRPALDEFIDSLKDPARSEFYANNRRYFDTEHVAQYDVIESDFKEKGMKIVGGLIGKMAFAVVGNEKILENSNIPAKTNKLISAPFFDDKGTTQLEERLREIIIFPDPSTGYCVSRLLEKMTAKNPGGIKTVYMQFGEEIAYVHDVGSDPEKRVLTVTCDYLSIDYLEKNRLGGKGIKELGDYVSLKNNAMFTGIIANTKSNDLTFYKSFLYAIDKNLYLIDKYLFSKNQSVTLAEYIKSQLLKNPEYKDNLQRVISFLVGCPAVEQALLSHAKAGGKNEKEEAKSLEEGIESLINAYVRRLARWKNSERHLYYPSVKAPVDDIKKIYAIRQQAMEDGKMIENWDEVADFSLLDDWYKKERTLLVNKTSKTWRFFTNELTIIFFSALLVMTEVVSIILKIIHLNFEPQDKPLGSVFGLQIGLFTLLWICIIIFSALVFVGVYINLRIHYLKKYEEFVFRDFPKGKHQ